MTPADASGEGKPVSIRETVRWTWTEPSRYGPTMDWLWPLYERYVRRLLGDFDGISDDQASLQDCFLSTLSVSTATIYVMEPTAKGAIIFKGLGHWPLPDEPGLLADPNEFLAARYGGGKFKVNFHHGENFVATHNFRTWGEESWRTMQEVIFD